MIATDYTLIANAESLRTAVEELKQQPVLGFDTETTSLDPYRGRLRLVQLATPDGVSIIDLDRFGDGDLKKMESLAPLRELLAAPRPIKIAHNAKFDAKWVKHTLGVELGGLFDTLLASQIISAGDTDERHGLEAVASRYLGETVDKAEQLSDWSGELSEAQLEYAARDAAVLPRLREKQIEKLKADVLFKCAQLEFECVLPVAALELAGIYLDKERWREQLAIVEKKRAQLAETLQDMLAEESMQGSLFGGPTRVDLNIDSHVQLTKALKRRGIEVPDGTRNWKLQPLAEKHIEIKTLLEYRTVQKALTSYGENILNEISPVTGRIHADFRQIGAPTGRFACTNPNIQQVPHSYEYRRCFRAPAGRKLIISDYSQIELRILADFTNDQGFVDAFNSGADLHKVTAAQVFNTPLDQVTKDQRDFAKRLNFGVVYGIGAQRFSMMTGLSLTDAEDILRRYFATYRQLDSWLRDAAQRAVRERTARTASGRLARFRFDPEDRQAMSLAQRNGKNTPIQGCQVFDSRIMTKEHGYTKIGTLSGLSNVHVWDGSRFVRADVRPSGKKQKVKVEFWGGYYNECSPDHKFLTIDVNGRSKWRTPREFVKGNYVVLTEAIGEWSVGLHLPELHIGKPHNASRASVADATSDPFGLGVWLGRVASDGSLQSRQLYLLVAQHEEAILPQMKNFTEKFGHVSYAVKRGGRGTKPIHFLTLSALGLVKQLHESGLKTRIPDFAWRDSRILAGYLRGMFDGDGTVNQDGAILTFGKGPDFYLEWAREIQQALLLFGIRSRIHRCADRINVCVLKRDMPLFCERIGFINARRQEKALAIKDGTGHENKIYGRAVRIKSVDFTDEWVEMYDVVDSETSQFMVNGLVTHNSSADILKRALRLLHDELRDTSACIVNIVHDEIVVEADANETETIAKKVEDAMCKAGEEYVKKVPVKVETEVSDEWVK
jgi:DNA polymerase I-like protein with 3'-5' exonuclease and polymerase domains